MATWNERIDNIQSRLANLVSEEFSSANFYNIEITPSDYNPSIDTNITLTVTVTNASGDAIEDYEVQLYKNGVSMGSSYNSITNSNGIVTFTVACDDWGLFDFSVGNSHCQVRVTGPKSETITVTADSTKISSGTKEITAVRNDNLVTVYCNFYNVTLAINNNASTDFDLGTLPSGWRPQTTIHQRVGQINDSNLANSRIKITTGGVISVMFNANPSGSGKTFRTTLTFAI